ncbi:MAG: MarR family transcriptional regulator [Alphaproteobacteria bacterium]|nr:MAG: MarR family transcriptional regulator [Alphaproteobacteria bacterium]
MQSNLNNAGALDLLRLITSEGVRKDSPDLTARQLAVLLTVYVTPPPHTVRGLAADLNITKPAITRALDRLTELNLIGRMRDETNKRSVLVQRTPDGMTYLNGLAEVIKTAQDQIAKSAYHIREAA